METKQMLGAIGLHPLLVPGDRAMLGQWRSIPKVLQPVNTGESGV